MKKIALLSEDKNTCSIFEAGLKGKFDALCFANIQEFFDILQNNKIDAVVIDNDISQISGMEVLLKIRKRMNKVKSIMLSQKGDINTAVKAGRAGVFDLIPKPLQIETLIESIERVFESEILKEVDIFSNENTEWLRGTSKSSQDFIKSVIKASQNDTDVVLVRQNGISPENTARIIHNIGPNRHRKFVAMDLSSFEKESSEPLFWAGIFELVSENSSDSNPEKDVTGTIYLANFDRVSDHFGMSIIKYLGERWDKPNERNIKFIISVSNTKKILGDQELKNIQQINIPALADRKEDIPLIVSSFLKKYSLNYNKNIQGVSSDVMDLLVFYNWPGNYKELECILESAVLCCGGDCLQITDLSLDISMIIQTSLSKIISENGLSLTKAKEKFKADLLKIVLAHAKNDLDLTAKFLDMPKTALMDEIDRLCLNTASF